MHMDIIFIILVTYCIGFTFGSILVYSVMSPYKKKVKELMEQIQGIVSYTMKKQYDSYRTYDE